MKVGGFTKTLRTRLSVLSTWARKDWLTFAFWISQMSLRARDNVILYFNDMAVTQQTG